MPGQLAAPIHHHSITSWFHMVDKANRFTSHEIGKIAAKPRWMLMLRLLTEMPLQFLRNYILRGHWLGGWKGFVLRSTRRSFEPLGLLRPSSRRTIKAPNAWLACEWLPAPKNCHKSRSCPL